MRKFLLANFIIAVGLTLSVIYSVGLFGLRNTSASVKALTGRTLSLLLPADVFAHDLNFVNVVKDITKPLTISDLNITNQNEYSYKEMLYPMIIPTTGIAGHKNFLYLPDIHPGIDIWSNIDGSGIDSSKHGYPVLAACSGFVSHYKEPNEEIEIICDKLPDHFKNQVPSLKVKILYSHLGDGETGESFHHLRIGQRINKGEFVGYQGNKSSFAPENRVIHLHFGIYDLSSRVSPPPPLDPMLYTGIDTHTVGQKFNSELF